MKKFLKQNITLTGKNVFAKRKIRKKGRGFLTGRGPKKQREDLGGKHTNVSMDVLFLKGKEESRNPGSERTSGRSTVQRAVPL